MVRLGCRRGLLLLRSFTNIVAVGICQMTPVLCSPHTSMMSATHLDRTGAVGKSADQGNHQCSH